MSGCEESAQMRGGGGGDLKEAEKEGPVSGGH